MIDKHAAVGPWMLHEQLGSGGMGSVWRATAKDGRTAAVKLIRADLRHDEEAIRRFRREFDIARRVTTRRVAVPLEADLEHDPPYIAWEYVDGSTLLETVGQSEPLGTDAVVRFARDMAEALRDLEGAGITHRDVKPANILLSEAGAVLVDLGVALLDAQTGLTSQGHVIGTPGWLTPEQLNGDRPTAASDVFNWAGVVVFAATGHGPFGVDTLPRLMYRVAHEPPDLAGVPTSVRPIVSAALAKKPSDRPTARELAAHLNAIIDGIEPVVIGHHATLSNATVPAGLPTVARASTTGMAQADLPTTSTTVGRPAGWRFKRPAAAAAAVAVISAAAYAALQQTPDAELAAAQDEDPTTEPVTETTSEPTPSPTPTSTPTEPAETDEGVAAFDYVTVDGTDPTAFPDCSGVLGVCLGNPIERVTERFGVEDYRYDAANGGGVIRAWDLESASLTVTSDAVGSVDEISVGAERGTRVSTPIDEVTVGATTFEAFAAAVGFGGYPTILSGEGFTSVGFVAWAGPEGSEAWQGSVSIDWSDPSWEPLMDSGTDLDLIIDAIGDRVISGFSVGYDFPEQEDIPPANSQLPPDWGGHEAPPYWVYDILADPSLNNRGSFDVADASLWNPDVPVNVVIGHFAGSATGRGRYAFFFAQERGYLGTDAIEASQIVTPAWRDDTTIALDYTLYAQGDPGCCPTGGTATVRFHWNGEELIALDDIPPTDGPISR